MRLLKRICTLVMGLVFFGSGMLKLMDPVGTSLIVDEYLSFFHLGFLDFASYVVGAALGLVETLLGAALICGVWKKVVSLVLLAIVGFFTIITLILLIFNPTMDCGCFGEAVHLTHLQSFLKNIALLLLWAVAYLPFKISTEPARKVKYVSFSIACISTFLFFLYSSLSLPLLDFTDYKPDTEFIAPEDADFESGELPFMLSFSNAAGEYADSLILSDRVIVVSVYDPATLPERRWDKISGVVRDAHAAGYLPLVLVNSTPEDISSYVTRPELLSCIYFADRKELLTLNRANGGYVYVADGLIIRKWSALKPPVAEYLAEVRDTDPVELLIDSESANSLKFQGYMLFVLAVMLLL